MTRDAPVARRAAPSQHVALLLAGAGGAALALPAPSHAQLRPEGRRFWAAAAVALAGTAASDRRLRAVLRGPGAPAVRATARAVEPLGRARTAVVGLGVTFVAAHLLDAPGWAHATGRVAAGYVAADAITAVLKPLVGRARPGVGAGPYAFRPLAGDEAHHAFASGHATHAFALAAGLAAETRRPWAAAVAYGAAGLVGWSRVHDDAHWTSDVVAGAVVGTAAGLTTGGWLRGRRPAGAAAPDPASPGARTCPIVRLTPAGVAVRLTF